MIKYKTNIESFLEDIEKLVSTKKLSYIDAVVFWCENKNIEIETISSVISKNLVLKAKIQEEGENLHILPKIERLL